MASENGSESDISISFPLPPPPPQPHFYCFPPPPPPQFFCFPPPPPLPPHFYCFLSFAYSFHFFFFLHDILYKDCQLPSLVHFVAMSRVVNNNRGFLQLLADCPAHQRQFLLKTATPQQLHALVQVLYNILKEYILIPAENKRNVLPYKDALVNLAETNVPYKTKKRILVQEGDGFIQDLLVPAVTSLGFLML